MKELSWHERGRLWLRLGLRLGLAVLAIGVFWKLGLPVISLLMPFVVALVMAWLFNPVIRWVQKKLNLRRGFLSVVLLLLTMALVGGVAAGFVWTLFDQLRSFFQNWQGMWSDTLAALNAVADWLEEWLHPLPGGVYEEAAGLLDKLVAWITGVVPTLLAQAAGNAGSVAMSLPSWGLSFIIFLMATYFISSDYPRMRQVFTSRMPDELRGFCSQVKQIAVGAFGGYVRAELIITFFVFLILLVGFFLMGEPYALLLAILLGILDFIPIVGSGTIMVPWAVIDVVLGNYVHALWLMVVWGIIVLFRRVAEPKVVGDQTGLSPIASLLSIYVGMKLGGVLGMVLGPILCLIAVNIARSGVFDNAVGDVRLAVKDIQAILRGGEVKK